MPRPPDPADCSEADWRVEVGRFRRTHPQRRFPLEVALGRPAGPRAVVEVPWPVPAAYDDGLRFDLAVVLAGRWAEERPDPGPAWGWVARVGGAGVPEAHDEDHGWHAALWRAAGTHDIELAGFRVVTKHGWLDLRTGRSRSWARLRL